MAGMNALRLEKSFFEGFEIVRAGLTSASKETSSSRYRDK